MNQKIFNSLDLAIDDAGRQLKTYGKQVPASHWQGVEVTGKPDMVSLELLNHSFAAPIPDLISDLQDLVQPNLPWADDHFAERVGGIAMNPGEQYKNWPYYSGQGPAAERFRTEGGKFTHTYMERMWPPKIRGIRYLYGDTLSVVRLLIREPLTRQAFLPIWFPEDTGATHGGRVPCTLGYQFMMRDNMLHMWYPIRACDYFRHFRDDIYLACRLNLWVLKQLKIIDPATWGEVKPGLLTMQIFSLHCFMGDVHRL